MMERLTFNLRAPHSPSVLVVGPRLNLRRVPAAPVMPIDAQQAAAARRRERYDWDYLWMLAFTGLLFFRPQDHFRPIAALHLAELTAIAGLAAMAVRRLSAGQTIAKINSEMVGILALGAVIVLTIPFSFWPGGSVKLFSDIYVKIILIFALMMSTLTTPRRLQQMTWVMMLASAYIAARGIFDYARGVNLVEGNRLGGAVGGLFGNPNDLALNLVTFLAPTLFIIVRERIWWRRLLASAMAAVMFAAILFTKSRSGFLGLIVMMMVIGVYTVRIKPGIVFAIVVAALIAVPMLPETFWTRMDSITNAEEDTTGSRAARVRLLEQGIDVFIENPVTGIGAGQFRNYDGPGMVERWRVTHNVWLQIAAELGIFGLLVFAYLVTRAFRACLVTMKTLRPKKKDPATLAAFTESERRILEMNAKGMMAALVGWSVCSMFASVAFNWTFYFVLALAVAGREVATSLRASAVSAQRRDERLVPAHA